ncbi:MAG: methyltransferase domain-containing protein [Planctomycetota bacterium]|nr:methyltransferase domain-containing protein [Planctomycetota bacterium]
MQRSFVLFFAAATGYISLSQEMLWMRLVSYMTGGRPAVFAYVLGFFLVGVALGSFFAERLCQRRFATSSPVRFVGLMLVISAVFYHLSIAAVAAACQVSRPVGLAATALIVTAVSFLIGGIFPILCHYGARTARDVGLAISRVYMANIVGATLGPLLTGFLLMQFLPTDRIILCLTLATLLLGAAAFLLDTPPRLLAPAAAIGLACLIPLIHQPLYDHLLERFHLERGNLEVHYSYINQNRSGIIAVSTSPTGDILWGGGVYDGMFTTDPALDANGIKRAYMVAALHPNPKNVLEIGLASASWARVLADYPPTQKITAIEINPGYLDIIKHYPQQASILTDPKFTVHIDDGRRWLKRNPAAKFDFMLQNTTWHWRSHATNLLSADYFQLCKSHLNPGGVIYCNTTGCEDVLYTAAAVFKHVVRYKNFVAASDSPFTLTPEQIRQNLLKFQTDNKPLFASTDPALQSVLHELASADLTDLANALRSRRDLQLITDDNMAPEYKQSRLFNRDRNWRSLFLRLSSSQSTPPPQ